jgi:hypothetical protein
LRLTKALFAETNALLGIKFTVLILVLSELIASSQKMKTNLKEIAGVRKI